MVQRCKLHTNHTASDDDNRFRQFCGRQGICTVPHILILFDTRNRRNEVRRTRTNQKILGFVSLAVAGNGHEFVRTTYYCCSSADQRTVFVIQTLLDARYQFAHHNGLALLHGSKIERYVLCRYTVFLCVRRIIILLRAIQERFGRNTAYIQTRTSYSVLLEEHHIFTGFRGLLCCCIARRTSAYDC